MTTIATPMTAKDTQRLAYRARLGFIPSLPETRLRRARLGFIPILPETRLSNWQSNAYLGVPLLPRRRRRTRIALAGTLQEPLTTMLDPDRLTSPRPAVLPFALRDAKRRAHRWRAAVPRNPMPRRAVRTRRRGVVWRMRANKIPWSRVKPRNGSWLVGQVSQFVHS